MRVLYVTGDLREGDLLLHETAKASSRIQVELSPDLSDAVVQLDTAGPYELVLTESQLPNGDCLTLIDHIRQRNLPPAVVVIIGPHEEDPPARLLKAGADDYVVRRPNFLSRLPALIQQTAERHRGRSQRRARPLRVLYAGDIDNARRQLARAPFIDLEVAPLSSEGYVERVSPTQPGLPAADIVVLEDQTLEEPILKVLKETLSRWPDCQVILLLAPGQDDVAIQALRLGAADCITKTGDFFERLVLALERLMVRRDLAREKTALRSSEERLRMVIEFVPACVTLLAEDGTLLAMNWAGLSLVGAKQVEDIVGKNLCALVGPEQGEGLRDFIRRICSGERDATQIRWEGFDGVPRELEVRAVPLRRDPNGTTAALAVMQRLSPGYSGDAIGQPQDASELLKRSLKNAENQVLEINRRYAEDQASWVAERQELERSREVSEEQKKAAEEALATAEVALAEAAARKEAEHSALESALRESERQLEEAKRRAAHAEESNRVLEAKLATTEARSAEERDRLESLIGDLEQRLLAAFEQHRRNEEAVVAARAAVSEANADVDRERSLWRSLREDLERRVAEAEEKRSELEQALGQSESRRAEASQRQDADRGAWEERIRELELLAQSATTGRAQLEEALQAAETRCAEISAQAQGYQARLSEFQAAGGQLEQQRLAWEEQRRHLEQQLLRLQDDLQTAEARRLELEDRYRVEKERSEAAHGELVSRTKSVEEERDALRNDLASAESRIAEVAAGFENERSEWHLARQSFEERSRTLEEQLKSADGRAAAAAAELQSLQAVWETSRRELKQRAQDFESENAGLKKAVEVERAAREEQAENLRASCIELERRVSEALQKATMYEDLCRQAEVRTADFAQRFQIERAQWNSTRLQVQEELRAQEAAAASLREKLTETEARLTATDSEIQSLKACPDLFRQQMDEQRRRHEEERAALQNRMLDLEALHARAMEEHLSEKAAWTARRQELEDRLRKSDEKRVALEASLQAAEKKAADLNQRSSTELERWESIRREMDRQLEGVVTRASGFEEALHSAQSRCAELAEQLKTERAAWELQRLDVESKGRAADEHRAAVEEAVRRMQGAVDELSSQVRAKDEELACALKELQTHKAEVERLHKQQRESAARYQQVIQKWSGNFEQALANTIARCEHTEQERIRLLTAQQRAERESLEQQVARIRQEYQRLEESVASERAALEQELARWRSRHQVLVDSPVAAYALTAEDGRLLACNESFARMLGYSTAADVPMDSFDSFRLLISGRPDLADQIESEGVLGGFEWSTPRADGRRIRVWGSASRVPAGPDGKKLIEWFLTDISEKHFLEKELRQCRRVEAVGRLAAEVAPSLADLLISAESQIEALREAEAGRIAGVELVGQLKHTAARARTLAHQLRTFSQKQERRPETLDLNLELRKQEPVLRQLAGEDIELRLRLGVGHHSVTFVRQELEQALTTLIVIARDALPAGGTVTFETSHIEVQPVEPELDTEVSPGSFILLSVRAEGCGVKSARTTSALEELVRNNAGFIRIEAAHESETAVRIHLPLADNSETGN